MTQMKKTDQSSRKKIIKLGNEGAAFKTLVIRMLTEIVEYGDKIEEKNKGYAK